jgi:hypothetical protein
MITVGTGVIVALLGWLIVVLYRMARSNAPDSRMAFLNDMLTTIPGALRLRRAPKKERHERHLVGHIHHRHRFGV